jgi:hypothetical protein
VSGTSRKNTRTLITLIVSSRTETAKEGAKQQKHYSIIEAKKEFWQKQHKTFFSADLSNNHLFL